jgi:hypothetical protein
MTHRKPNPQLIDEAMAHFTIGDRLERNLEKNLPSRVGGHESVERPPREAVINDDGSPMDDHDIITTYERSIEDTFYDLKEAGADPHALVRLMDDVTLYAITAGRLQAMQFNSAISKANGGGA